VKRDGNDLHSAPASLCARRDFYGGCDASPNVSEFEKMALGVGIGDSGSRTMSASASKCEGRLSPVVVLDSFPIEKAIVTQHAKAKAAIAADLANRAEAEAAAAAVALQLDASDSRAINSTVSPPESSSSPMMLADAAAANISAAASCISDNFSRNNYRFALDLAPSLLLSLGPVVASIIKSGVGKKYLEFKAVRATYVAYNDSLLLLPASKGEIFSSQHLSLMDKRCLMKFFKAIGPVSDAGADAGAEKRLRELGHDLDGVSLAELMRRHDLDERLQSFVAFGMAGVARLIGTSASDGIASIAAYLQSIGRYSDSSPFLYCCYGCGEMAQAYCRMAAVYGGIYVLRRSVASILTEDNSIVSSHESEPTPQQTLLSAKQSMDTPPDSTLRKIKGVLLTDGQYVEAAHVISSPECWPASADAASNVGGSNTESDLRAIIISTKSMPLPPDSSSNATNDPGAPVLICVPPSSPTSASIITSCVRLLQLGSSCQVLTWFLIP
jgi:hypothetical protein